MNNRSVDLLCQYIRINTSNPPGNEYLAANFFTGILKSEGIACKTYESKPGRVSIRAMVKGSGKQKPLILLHHMDVIAAKRPEWSFDPFGGEIIHGYICGRGALDTKSLGIIQLLALLEIKHKKIKPDRDIVFLATADEESGADCGVEFLLREFPADFDAGLVLNEGSYILSGVVPDRLVAMISPGEKGPCWLKLKRKGIPGHGSTPHEHNPLERITHALSRLLDYKPSLRVTPIAAEYFKQMAQTWEQLQPYVEDGKDKTLLKIVTESGLLNRPQVRAMLSNTISLNSLHAGDKVNVIPSYAEALVDTRVLPGESADEWVQSLRKFLADDEIEVEHITKGGGNASDMDTDSYRIIEKALQEHYPGAITAPYLMLGTTDSRFFREKGISSYGFCPTVVAHDLMGSVHGIDEKISAESFVKGVDVYTDVVKRLCTQV
jgi:acetylornithine deacetylase/succinyl-diaminopimelate desuccinylase-like protein